MMKIFVKKYHWWYKNMQQWWFDDFLGLKSVIYGVFYDFSLIFKVFIIYSYICKIGYWQLRR